jgi:hypothetical protein
MPRRAVPVLLAGLLSAPGVARQGSVADLKTTPEASGFASTSTYEDVMKFVTAVDAASPIVHLTTYGTTVEGRSMPLVVVGRGVKDASAAAVRASGRLRVLIQGNIHAGEVEGKEAAQMLLRELAAGQHDDWLQSMVFLITPIYNADGNERFGDNRGRQHGPINGMGVRPNAQGYDLNRDHMKLDSPEAKALIKLWVDYDPHVGIDLHTTNGTQHGYYLTYAEPLNPNTSERIVTLLRNEWLPFMTKRVKAAHGWDFFFYGNVGGGGGRRGRGRGGDPAVGGRGGEARGAQPPAAQPPAGPRVWQTFEHVPRFNNNYIGLRNRFGILSEAFSYATFEDRIKATSRFLEGILTFAHDNAARLRGVTQDADRESIVGKTLATRARHHRGGTITILMGETEEDKNPKTGSVMWRRKDVTRPEQMIDGTTFEPSATETVPREYYVPAEAVKALELLRAHGVRVEQAKGPIAGLERFSIESSSTANFQQHAMRTLEGRWEKSDASVPAGSWVVSMNQPLARLAFYLLEPMSDDGLTNWNFLDDLLEGAKTYPILRRR